MPRTVFRPPLAASVVAASVAAAIAVAAAPLRAQNLIVNGDFESGDLSGWSRSGPLAGTSCAANWRVSSHPAGTPAGDYSENPGNGTWCLSVGGPPQGSFAAYNSFDGGFATPFTFRLEQGFVVPSGVVGASLSFTDALRWDYDLFPSFPGGVKTFAVTLVGPGDVTLATLHAFATAADGVGGYDWTPRAFDVTALLAPRAGQTLAVRFDATIPAPFVGPAGIGLDAVALEVTAVPEPATLALLAGGLLVVAAAARGRATFT